MRLAALVLLDPPDFFGRATVLVLLGLLTGLGMLCGIGCGSAFTLSPCGSGTGAGMLAGGLGCKGLSSILLGMCCGKSSADGSKSGGSMTSTSGGGFS